METHPKRLRETIIRNIITQYPAKEAEGLAYLVMEHCWGLDKKAVILNEELTISQKQQQELEGIIKRLKTHEPIQYVLGSTEFYGRKFDLNPCVLIPRPETEELVQLIVKENQSTGTSLLDIGTGSGCIAITLQLELTAQTFACDVGEETLDVAKHNALSLGASVDFFLCNILNQRTDVPRLDVLVSNPPYVTESEKQQMQTNVLSYEPSQALFVSDQDPLIFYRRIADIGRNILKPGGKLYFEINQKFGTEIKQLLENYQYGDVQVLKDFRGKDRFAKAFWDQAI